MTDKTQEPVASKQTFTRAEVIRAIEAERHACSIAVWMTLMEATEPGADDKGLDGWMREAEQRIKNRSSNDPEAAQQQEPEKVGRITANVKDMVLRQEVMLYTDDYLPIGTAIYTSPPASKPLTDEQIQYAFRTNSVMVDNGNAYMVAGKRAINITRAIEAAHGIKGDA